MSDRTMVAADPEHGVFILLYANDFMHLSSPSEFPAEKLSMIKLCKMIYVDRMGDNAPDDWVYSNPELKKMLKEDYGIELPIVSSGMITDLVFDLNEELERLGELSL